MSRLAPNTAKIIIETNLNEPAGIPLSLTIVDRKSVKNVKLPMNPRTTPRGFCFPDPSAEDKMIGSSGKIHGDKTVTIPARKAKAMRRNMWNPITLYLQLVLLFPHHSTW